MGEDASHDPEAIRKSGGPHVLVVDDDPMVRTIGAKLLESMGCTATTLADGGAVAEELARAREADLPYDLVLLDLQLGKTSGLDVCRSLRDAGSEVAIVSMSSGFTVTEARLFEAGFDGTLDKPFSSADLRACVVRYARWRAGAPPL